MGRRNFFVFCITVFTVASFLCGSRRRCPSCSSAVCCRAQAAAECSPWRRPSWPTRSSRTNAVRPFALYGLVAVLAPSIGPTLGGWITDNFSWRWIFFINIPVGILAFILVTRLVEDPPWIKADPSRLRNMDYVGLAFLAIAMGGLQIMLDKGRRERLVRL